ncbi:MAG TPA: hypothetical protein VFN27_06865 [Xanthobacteraceae bacterium]|nr:hypothetical protein [Xanthobacteraceae bacterium]
MTRDEKAWARRAAPLPTLRLLVLVFVIAIWLLGNNEAAHAISGRGEWLKNAIERSAPNPARLYRTGIVISDLTKTNEGASFIVDRIDPSLIESGTRLYPYNSEREPKTACLSDKGYRQIGWLKIAWQHPDIRVDHVKIYPETMYHCRSIAYVYEQDIYDDRFVGHERPHDPDIFDSDSRTVRGIKFGTSEFDRFIRHYPEFRTGAPESPSEQSDQECADRSDIIVVDISPNKKETPHNPLMEGGAGLIAGLIISGLILAYYYAKGEL